MLLYDEDRIVNFMSKSNKKENKDKGVESLDMPATTAEESSEPTTERDFEGEIRDLNDKYLRLFSEFDNFRKRTARERLELLKSASADLLTELLPVADDFDRTLTSFQTADENNLKDMVAGVKLVQSKFISTLERQGLKFFESMEKDFDPDFHEAITKIPAPSKKLKGKVVDVVEKGYMLNDRVLRYAKVVVGE